MAGQKKILNYNDLLNFMKKRRSARIYAQKMVRREDILKIIEAGIQAPSPTNLQGWKFRILDNEKEINYLTIIIEKKLDELINKTEEGILRESFTEYSGNFTFIKNSPCTILLYSLKPRKVFKSLFKDKINSYKGGGSLLSLGMVMQNMMLSAQSLGISSCPLTGPLIAEKEITDKYPPPQKYELSGLMTLGYADSQTVNPGRKSLDKFII